MTGFDTLDDLLALRETVEVEAKLASGRDGRGQIPADLWATYSAFANTRGGLIVLGLRERGEGFEPVGLPDPDRLTRDLFNTANNPRKVSTNLLRDEHVRVVTVEGRALLAVEVPRAPRRSQPVYLDGNPMTGTYRRLHEGDRLCDGETVRRMLAEQVGDTRDDRILRGFGLEDLDPESLATYRLALRDARPEHPYLDRDERDFVRQLGGWRRDREGGEEGLTVAGLLMFGRAESIREEFPNYVLDYREEPDDGSGDLRWTDRVTLDGTWSGNLFDFYRRVYRKLVADLKVPFVLVDGQRRDETPVHTALREALVNALVHADYSGRASILIIKRPQEFSLRNPGLMRVPPEVARQGGESDARNRALQSMFLLIGAGDRAGSGVPKIYKGWAAEHWRPPAYQELDEPSDQTRLVLRMIHFLPPETIEGLRARFGNLFDELDETQRLILATAATESSVSNARMQSLCPAHPADLTRTLQGLVQGGLLVQSGRSRGTTYHLATGANARESDDLDPRSADLARESDDLDPQSDDPAPQSDDLFAKTDDLTVGEPGTPPRGRTLDGLLVIDHLGDLDEASRADLEAIANRTRARGRLALVISRAVVRDLCDGRFMTLRVLAELLGRTEAHVRDRLVLPLLMSGALRRAYPAPNHPRQAYTATEAS